MGIGIEYNENELMLEDSESEAADVMSADVEDEEAVDTTFEVNGKKYEVAFNIKRIDLYERAGHKPIIASFAQNGGSFSLDELKSLVAYGTRPLGGLGYVSPKQGMAMAEKLIEVNGYQAVYTIVVQALERDCAFFFMGV